MKTNFFGSLVYQEVLSASTRLSGVPHNFIHSGDRYQFMSEKKWSTSSLLPVWMRFGNLPLLGADLWFSKSYRNSSISKFWPQLPIMQGTFCLRFLLRLSSILWNKVYHCPTERRRVESGLIITAASWYACFSVSVFRSIPSFDWLPILFDGCNNCPVFPSCLRKRITGCDNRNKIHQQMSFLIFDAIPFGNPFHFSIILCTCHCENFMVGVWIREVKLQRLALD